MTSKRAIVFLGLIVAALMVIYLVNSTNLVQAAAAPEKVTPPKAGYNMKPGAGCPMMTGKKPGQGCSTLPGVKPNFWGEMDQLFEIMDFPEKAQMLAVLRIKEISIKKVGPLETAERLIKAAKTAGNRPAKSLALMLASECFEQAGKGDRAYQVLLEMIQINNRREEMKERGRRRERDRERERNEDRDEDRDD